jgi:hypothetical protein
VSGFVKIYGSILRSTVWQQPATTKLVWLTMLILADADGRVEASIPGLAATAGVGLEECEAALACFLSPDKYSHNKAEEGRRIRACFGGWIIINHGFYRELRTQKQVRDAVRIAAKRAMGDRGVVQLKATRATCRNVDPDPDPDPDLDHSSGLPAVQSEQHASLARMGERPREADDTDDIVGIFECWRSVHDKPRARLDAKRRARIKNRLREKFTAAQLCQAIRGALKDPYLMGTDPKAARAFNGLDTILRDSAQVERLIELDEGKATASRGSPPEEERFL